jgi:Na+/phosphate symporter
VPREGSDGWKSPAEAQAESTRAVITFITTLPVLFMIVGLILMKWQKMKDWHDVGYVLFAAGSFALSFALASKTVALLK